MLCVGCSDGVYVYRYAAILMISCMACIDSLSCVLAFTAAERNKKLFLERKRSFLPGNRQHYYLAYKRIQAHIRACQRMSAHALSD